MSCFTKYSQKESQEHLLKYSGWANVLAFYVELDKELCHHIYLHFYINDTIEDLKKIQDMAFTLGHCF